ncbi:dystrophin-like [Mizuhopecten yessoensis]|uniref:Dystrophin, isoform E n=1 Tax=Mizuhopecten yessoensis TaxID=6573 RepID=A0A210PEB6_MIZYE|nr:dystrophin-like [Mizuhopecten yessoensis]OWF34829.1 Dystrophin, isoform E [Mizuhopecten yessoensis]
MDITETYDRIVDGWERAETNSGVPYYISHTLQRTTWDHPYLLKIMEELGEYSAIKYAAYRAAFKIRHLQKRLRLYQISISTVKDVFEQYGYAEGCLNVISCQEIHDLLTELYNRADHGLVIEMEDAEIHAELLQNLILNLFDVNRIGRVKVVSLKLVLITLCAAKLAEKYKAYYHELHDPSTYISSKSFTSFLEDMIQLPDLLQESGLFGQDVAPAVASCMQMSNGGVGISDDVFYSWLLREPQTLVWLPTFHRTAASEAVKHESKCNICKSCPIVGFRYKCLLCFNFDMCQNCFFTGRTKKNHKLKHPIQEYCLKTSSKEDTKAFFRTMRNKVSKKHRQKAKQKYLPLMSENQYCQNNWSVRAEPPIPDVHRNLTENAQRLADLEIHNSDHDKSRSPVGVVPNINISNSSDNKENVHQVDNLKKQRDELERVIKELEEENRQLHRELKDVRESSDTESNMSGGENPAKKTKFKVKSVLDKNRRHSGVTIVKEKPLSSLENMYGLQTGSVPSPSYNDSQTSRPLMDSRNMTQAEQSVLYSSHRYSSPPESNTYAPSPNSNSYNPSSHSNSLSSRNDTTSPSLSPNLASVTSPYTYEYSSRFRQDLSPGESHFTPRASEGAPSYIDRRERTGFDSLDNLDVSPSHFTLPSFANSRAYLEEEEVDQMQMVDKIFPSNLSYSAYSMSNAGTMNDHEEMLQAASTMGTVTSDLFSEAIIPFYQ